MIRRPILFASSFRGFRRSFSTSPLVSNYLLSWDQHMEAIREVGRSHAASHADTIDKLNSRLQTTTREMIKDQNLISNLEREVADLKKKNAKIQGCFTVMTVLALLEIITDLYCNRLPNPMGKDVQTILDMIVKGRFDHQNSITYANAQNAAISAEDDPIVLQEKDYTHAEAIAIFSFVHFARICNLRMLYFNSEVTTYVGPGN
ncbi:MAG: hypothetical protein NXY57DRAFT_1042925 [Lentinula lateritia]|nr:MAG: hypothetical protein NXY57DRAFT_1042925 [Lentinula lateritia]